MKISFLFGALLFLGCTNGILSGGGNGNNNNGGGPGGISFVQATPKGEGASQPTTGDLIVVYFCQLNANVTSVVDTYGNTYAQAEFATTASWFSYIYCQGIYNTVSSTGSYAQTWSTPSSAGYATVIASFKGKF